MERISGASNWQLIIRREPEGITILQAGTCDRKAELPETLFDLPVVALGRRALSSGAAESGEPVEITCGRCSDSRDNSALEELTLPPSLRRVEDYALLNCRSLRTLHLSDGVTYWGGGVFMNCRSLARLHLTWGSTQGETLAYFADELSGELDVTVDGPGGRARLIFPEYVEIYEENCPAHHFDYTIQGAGYPYHHCFRNKQLRFQDYDALWDGYLSMDHEEATALAMAWYRLRYPVELGEEAEAGYRTYLVSHGGEALRWLTEQGDAAGIAWLLKWAEPDGEALGAACAAARERGAAEVLAVLLDARNHRIPRKKTFEL